MQAEKAVGAVLVSVMAVVVLIVLYYAGIPPCDAVAPVYVAAILLLLSPLVMLPLLGRLCRVRVSLEDGAVRVRLGLCGSIEIPATAVRAVKVVERVEPELRLAGTALPGFYYTGLFLVRGVGRAYIFSERLHNLVELRLADGKTVYLGGDAVEKLARLSPGSTGGPAVGTVEFHVAGGRILPMAAAAVVAAYFAAAPLVYSLIPERAPTHFTFGWKPDSWGSRWDVMATYFIAGGINVFMLATYLWVRRRDPVSSVLLVPVIIGVALLGVSTALLSSKLCTWWQGPG